jgi:hypothetical protein
VKVNDVLICPKETPPREGEGECAKVEMNGEALGGRWNGTLTLYPQFAGNRVKVDIELDEQAWALGVRLNGCLGSFEFSSLPPRRTI